MLVQFRCSLFGDFQHRAFFDFGGDGPDKRPHGLGGPALFADNFANVHFSDFELHDGRIQPVHFRHGYAVRLIRQRLCNGFNDRSRKQ